MATIISNDFSVHPEISTLLHVPDILKLQRIRVGCRVHLQKLEATEDGAKAAGFSRSANIEASCAIIYIYIIHSHIYIYMHRFTAYIYNHTCIYI